MGEKLHNCFGNKPFSVFKIYWHVLVYKWRILDIGLSKYKNIKGEKSKRHELCQPRNAFMKNKYKPSNVQGLNVTKTAVLRNTRGWFLFAV